MSDASDQQAYPVSEANKLKSTDACDPKRDGYTSFVDEWVRLSTPQQASVIKELGIEAKDGDKEAAATLRKALDNYETPTAEKLNNSLRQVGDDVTITDEYIDDLRKNSKGVTVKGQDGQYFHENSVGEIIAMNDPAYGNGKYYANSKAVGDYAMRHALPSYIPSPDDLNATYQAMTAKQIKRENW